VIGNPDEIGPTPVASQTVEADHGIDPPRPVRRLEAVKSCASIRPMLRGIVLLFAVTVAAGCGPDESRDRADVGATRTLAKGLEVPWGIAFLPGGDALVSERATGRILRISRDGSRKRTVMRVPGVDTDSGEGGLLGLALSPRYARDRLVYAYFTSTPTTASSASSSVAGCARS
jgi:Glucose / Sorbosone dehydrogenase